MEILSQKDRQDFLGYLPYVKASLKEWLFVDIRLADDCDADFSVETAASLVQFLFKANEGRIYICNRREMLMMIRWGEKAAGDLTTSVERHLPPGSCEVHAQAPSKEGIGKLEMLITYKKPVVLADIRKSRQEKIVVIADDDMYMRMLVKKGMPGVTSYEIGTGDEVFAAYKKYVPDILFLDIHMPNMDGTQVLLDILSVDPEAYVIMLSADSSRENVELATKRGARGFLAKPFTKEKLQECLQKCPTMNSLPAP